MVLLIKNKKGPPEKPVISKGTPVRCIKLKKQNIHSDIYTTGTVESYRKITVIPEVGGKIISVAKNFEQGGIFKKGDEFFRIDPEDYQLAARISKANISKAETSLLETKSRAAVALKEWETANKFSKIQAASPLVLYRPQLKHAEAVLESAQADYAKKLLDIKRTIIKAPFNCIVLSESIAQGRVVSRGCQLALIAGTDFFDIVVAIPYSDMDLINIPSILTNKRQILQKDSYEHSATKNIPGKYYADRTSLRGSEAEITLDTGIGKYMWKSFVHRMLGNVEPSGRMPRIVLRISDPLNLNDTHGKTTPPLAEGSFVSVKIKGKIIKNVFPIPEEALRENSTIWIMLNNNTLDIRHVNLVRRQKNTVFIRGNIKENEKLIVTAISGAARGTKLRESID